MNAISLTPHLPYTPIKTLDLSRSEKLNREVEAFLASGGKVKVLAGFDSKIAKPALPVSESPKAKPKGNAVAKFKRLTVQQINEIEFLLRKKGVTKTEVSVAVGVNPRWLSSAVKCVHGANPKQLKAALDYLHSLPNRGDV